MYFWNYGLRKTWLDICVKVSALEDPLTSNIVNGSKRCWNLNNSIFTIFIIDQGKWKFSCKKSPLVICKILGHFVNALTADDNYSLLKRGKLLQHFQMQLSKKQKIFSQFFFIFEIHIWFWTFSKKRPSYLMYFLTYGLRKTQLDKSLKSLERTLGQVTCKTGRNTVEIWTRAPLPYLLIPAKCNPGW